MDLRSGRVSSTHCICAESVSTVETLRPLRQQEKEYLVMEKQIQEHKNQSPLCLNVDGCQATIHFTSRQEGNVLEDIKRMILSGLKK